MQYALKIRRIRVPRFVSNILQDINTSNLDFSVILHQRYDIYNTLGFNYHLKRSGYSGNDNDFFVSLLHVMLRSNYSLTQSTSTYGLEYVCADGHKNQNR